MSVSYHCTVGFVSVDEYDSDGPLTMIPGFLPGDMKSTSRDKKMTLMALEIPPIVAPCSGHVRVRRGMALTMF